QEAATDASSGTPTGDAPATPSDSQPLDTSALDAALENPGTGETTTDTDASSPTTQTTSESAVPDATAPLDTATQPSSPQAPLTPSQPGEPQVLNPTFTYQSIAPKVDKTTGALVETLQLAIPPGRNGLQPDLALVYNSQRLEESVVGYGWTVNVPYIERINRRGTNNLYSDDYFNSSLSGELASTSISGQYA